jgi:hypothetical protein
MEGVKTLWRSQLCTRCPGLEDEERKDRQHRRENTQKLGNAHPASEKKEKLDEKLARSSRSSAAFLDGRTLRKEQNVKNNGKGEKDLWKRTFYLSFCVAHLWKHSTTKSMRAPWFGMEKMKSATTTPKSCAVETAVKFIDRGGHKTENKGKFSLGGEKRRPKPVDKKKRASGTQ